MPPKNARPNGKETHPKGNCMEWYKKNIPDISNTDTHKQTVHAKASTTISEYCSHKVKTRQNSKSLRNQKAQNNRAKKVTQSRRIKHDKLCQKKTQTNPDKSINPHNMWFARSTISQSGINTQGNVKTHR